MDNKGTPHNKKRLLIMVPVLLILAAILIFGMPVHLPEQAALCGVDVSGMRLRDAEELLAEKVQDYSLKVTVGEQAFEIKSEEIGLVLLDQQFKSVVRSSLAEGTAADPWSLMTLDLQKLAAQVTGKFDEQHTPAQAPTVVFDEAENAFRAVPGQPETWYNRELLVSLLLDSIANLPAELNISEDALYQERHDAKLQASAEALARRANELMAQEFTYEFRPRQYPMGSEVLSSDVIASFLRFDVENERIYADEQAVSTYVDYVSPKYNYNKLKDRFLAHDGGRINLQVIVQPQSVNREDFTRLIAETVTAGQSGSFEVPYTGARNFDGTYIEASISEQHLWVYKDNVCVLDTPIVTGFEVIGNITPVGLNYVRGHLRNIELFGDSFVEYCLSFTTGGQFCFHDADHWREPQEYGGTTYQSNGSGGCVNIPVRNMAKMYEIVEDGTPVLIHRDYHYDRYSFLE